MFACLRMAAGRYNTQWVITVILKMPTRFRFVKPIDVFLNKNFEIGFIFLFFLFLSIALTY
jgi:hypothetical protein